MMGALKATLAFLTACLGLAVVGLTSCQAPPQTGVTPTASVASPLTTLPMGLTQSIPAPRTASPTSGDPALTLTATPSVAPASVTPTPMAVPTLPLPERVTRQRRLLETNGGCPLPCWWGIVPGQTTWAAARQMFADLGAGEHPAEGTPTPGQDSHSIAVLDTPSYTLGLVIGVQDDLVRSIRVTAHDRAAAPAEAAYFADDWHAETAQAILAAYGPPSRVELWVDPKCSGETECIAFEVFLFYDAVGFLVVNEWAYPSDQTDAMLSLCPGAYRPYRINLYLHAATDTLPLQDLIGWPTYGYRLGTTHSLEEATGLDPQAFYQVYSRGATAECMETPLSLWARP